MNQYLSNNSLAAAEEKLNISESEFFVFPASFAQQRLWFLQQLAPGNPFYNVSTALRLKGSLNLTALEQTFNEIVRRHETLRTTFVMVEGQPMQVIAPSLTLSIPIIDLRNLSTTERETEAQQLAIIEAKRPFDLAKGPLLRITLLQLGEFEYILLLNLHHIVADGWSIAVLIRELAAFYTAFVNNQPSPLPELPIQYADFAEWQRQCLQGEVLETQLSSWRQQLNGITILNLPTDKPRPAIPTYRGARQFLTISRSLSEALKSLSQRENVTLFMTLLAAFQTLLYRYTGQEDIAVGSPIANRNRSEIEGLIGFFVNSLVLRTDLSGNPTFREVLSRVREVAMGAYAHQDLPFEKLVEELHPERDLSRNPLFQVSFSLQNTPVEALYLPELTFSAIEFDTGTAKLDLEFHFWEDLESLKAQVVYSTDLFDDTTITRILGHFQTLLEGIIANSDERISELPILTEGERQQLLIDWNDTRKESRAVGAGFTDSLSGKQTIELNPPFLGNSGEYFHQLFEAQVEQTPDAIALVFEKQQLTYRELNKRANQLAHYLRQLGVVPEVLVGICVDRSIDMIVGILGILKAGGAYLPLDPSYPQERLNFMLEDAKVSVLVTQQNFTRRRLKPPANSFCPLKWTEQGKISSRLEPTSAISQGINSLADESVVQDAGNEFIAKAQPDSQIQNPIVVCLDKDWEITAQKSQENPTSNVTPDNLAYVIYTSGSTGKPKGVLIQHKGLYNLAEAQIEIFKLQPNNRILQFASLSFDASIFEIVMALRTGATLYLVKKETLLSGQSLIKLLRDNAITHVTLPPAVLAVLPKEELPALQTIICAGESCSQDIVKQWSFGRRFFNAYGPTEATVWATIAEVSDDSKKPPIGRPIPNTQVYILDKHLQPVPIGITGELYIGGEGLARGYLNRPDLTAQRFIPHPFSQMGCRGEWESGGNSPSQSPRRGGFPNPPVPRLYKTGDLASYLPDGNIQFLGRIDEQVKIRGFRIELGEIEAVLSQHPAVRETVAIALEDGRLVAYILPQENHNPTITEIRDFLKNKLPDYMVPSAFVILDSLPLTPNGKIDRQALPAPSNLTNPKSNVAPENETEKAIAQIFAELLNQENVGIHDNFFDSGGDSLLAIRLIDKIQKQFERELPLSTLFLNPTVEGLAKTLNPETNSLTWSPLVAIQPKGSKPPFFCVHPILGVVFQYYELAFNLGKDQPFYGLQPQGLDGKSPPFNRIEDMAAYYIEAMRKVQPNGPYFIGGWSFGGLVAFEMAQQLVRAGDKVGLLAVLDTGAPIAENKPTFWESWKFLFTIAGRYMWPFLLDYIYLVTMAGESRRRILSELTILPMLRVYQANSQAAINYAPQIYPGKITLFRSSEQTSIAHQDSTMGWNSLSAEGVEVCTVPGNHLTMLRKPNVEVLAERLRETIHLYH